MYESIFIFLLGYIYRYLIFSTATKKDKPVVKINHFYPYVYIFMKISSKLSSFDLLSNK